MCCRFVVFCFLLFCAFMGNFANWHLTDSIQFRELTIRIFWKLTRWSLRLYMMEEGDSKYPLLPSKHEGIFEDCNFWTRWVYLLWEIWVKKFNIFPSVPSYTYTMQFLYIFCYMLRHLQAHLLTFYKNCYTLQFYNDFAGYVEFLKIRLHLLWE
jgi:hypothetical protein